MDRQRDILIEICRYTSTSTYTYTSVYTHIHVYMYIYMCVCVCVSIHPSIHTYIYGAGAEGLAAAARAGGADERCDQGAVAWDAGGGAGGVVAAGADRRGVSGQDPTNVSALGS